MFMKNAKWWKVGTFPVFTSWTFLWTGLHHPCLPGISPISPIVWRTNTSPVKRGCDGVRWRTWTDWLEWRARGVSLSPGVTADSQCLGIHCEAEKSLCLCPCPWVCAPWNHLVSHPHKLQILCTHARARGWQHCLGCIFGHNFLTDILVKFPSWTQNAVSQFRGPFSFFQSFFCGNEQLKWTKAAAIHIGA